MFGIALWHICWLFVMELFMFSGSVTVMVPPIDPLSVQHLWILVTCQGITAIWLLGHFTQIMQYRVSTEFVHGWISVLWHSHTQLQCERWHVITTGHTHTVINILTAVPWLRQWHRSPWRPGSIPGHYTWYFWWTKCHWDRSLCEYFSFPCQYHSTSTPYSVIYLHKYLKWHCPIVYFLSKCYINWQTQPC